MAIRTSTHSRRSIEATSTGRDQVDEVIHAARFSDDLVTRPPGAAFRFFVAGHQVERLSLFRNVWPIRNHGEVMREAPLDRHLDLKEYPAVSRIEG
jgi:hypothetical protein